MPAALLADGLRGNDITSQFKVGRRAGQLRRSRVAEVSTAEQPQALVLLHCGKIRTLALHRNKSGRSAAYRTDRQPQP